MTTSFSIFRISMASCFAGKGNGKNTTISAWNVRGQCSVILRKGFIMELFLVWIMKETWDAIKKEL